MMPKHIHTNQKYTIATLNLRMCAAAVGVMYGMGQGCTQDPGAALSWLRKSYQGGSTYGAGLLSRHYLDAKMFLKATEVASRSVVAMMACQVGRDI